MAKYRIADLIIEMDSFGRTKEQAEPYRVDTDQSPDIVITSSPDKLLEKNPQLTMDDCEYLSTGVCFYNTLLDFNGMLLHSSCVVVDGKAYLFTAPCGTGKSTHVRLWMKLFGDRAYILNDDKPAIRVVGQDIYVYGTPWSGKNDCSRNERVSLGGIAVVRRAKENSIRKLDTEEAVFVLLDQTARTISPIRIASRMDMIDKIVSTGKVYELSCNMDISAAMLSYETMSGKRYCYED